MLSFPTALGYVDFTNGCTRSDDSLTTEVGAVVICRNTGFVMLFKILCELHFPIAQYLANLSVDITKLRCTVLYLIKKKIIIICLTLVTDEVSIQPSG